MWQRWFKWQMGQDRYLDTPKGSLKAAT